MTQTEIGTAAAAEGTQAGQQMPPMSVPAVRIAGPSALQPKPAVLDLETAATEIRSEIGLAEQFMRKGIEHARKAGELLVAVRASGLVPKGEWEKFVRERVGIGERSAQQYVRLFEKWNEIEEAAKAKQVSSTDLTINKALSLTATPRKAAGQQPAAEGGATGPKVQPAAQSQAGANQQQPAPADVAAAPPAPAKLVQPAPERNDAAPHIDPIDAFREFLNAVKPGDMTAEQKAVMLRRLEEVRRAITRTVEKLKK